MINQSKIEYNLEPVYYCDNCLSLRIKTFDSNIDFCSECGNTDIANTSIVEWEKLYHNKYNKNHLTHEKNNNTEHTS